MVAMASAVSCTRWAAAVLKQSASTARGSSCASTVSIFSETAARAAWTPLSVRLAIDHLVRVRVARFVSKMAPERSNACRRTSETVGWSGVPSAR
eukprot:scaffold8421_cov114-Isochrysis_galbana.AAC.12